MRRSTTCLTASFFLRLAVAIPATASLWLVCTTPLSAQVSYSGQEGESLTLAEASRLGALQSPVVRAAQRRLEAAEAALRGARAPFTPRAEIAPGVGFTNGNALLSQQFDISGLRSAARARAEGERAAAQAAVTVARLQVVAETRAAYADLMRARAAETSAQELVQVAEALKTAVARRVEIGEAPAVQVARAEIEVARAEQELVRARADSGARLAVLNRLLGRKRDQPVTPTDTSALPAPPLPVEQLVEAALQNRPQVAVALAQLAAQRGSVAVARAASRPTLHADLTADVWSLDPHSWDRRTASGNLPLFGAQVRFGFALGQDRAQQAEVDRARAAVAEQEAEIESVRRAVALEVERLAADLLAARTVTLRYQETILPKAEDLARATRAGYDKGLSTFLEVLESQRLQRQVRLEYQNALYDAVRARITLDTTLGLLPKEVQP